MKKRFISMEEQEQKEQLNREQDNELMYIRFSFSVGGLVKCRVSEWYELVVHNRIKTTDKDNALFIVKFPHFVGCEQFPAKHVIIA